MNNDRKLKNFNFSTRDEQALIDLRNILGLETQTEALRLALHEKLAAEKRKRAVA